MVRESGELFSAQKNRMQGNIVQKKLFDPNGLGNEWFVNLMFNPLYSRPLVVEMIREHLKCVLKRYEFKEEDFQSSLIELVEAQLKMFLEEKNLPSVLRHLDGFKDVKLPLIGHISTYTLNITILAALLSDNGFVFDERNYRSDNSQESETSPWDKLSNLWKTWFSSDNLTGLARIIRSNRKIVVVDEQKFSIITLSCPEQLDDVESGLNKIEKQLSVANALSDQMSIALSGLQTTRFTDITKKKTEDILSILKSVNPNLYVRYVINLIRRELYHPSDHKRFSKINELIDLVLQIDLLDELNLDVVIEYLVIIEVLLSRHLVYLETQKYIFKLLNDLMRRMEPRKDYSISINRIAIQLSRNLDGFFDSEEMHHYGKNMPFHIRDLHENSDRLSLRENEMFFDKKSQRFSLDFDDDKRFSFLSEDNLIEYMRTDPEMVSRYLLSVSRQIRNQSKGFCSIVHGYLKYIYNCFRDRENISKREFYEREQKGFSKWEHDEFIYSKHMDEMKFNRYPMIGLRTLIYSIQIAANIKDEKHQHIAHEMALKTIQHNRPEYFSSIIFSSPELFIITIENIPEIFDKRYFEYFGRDMEYFFDRSLSRNSSIYLALAYIKLIKNSDLHHDVHITEFQHMMFKVISQAINEFADSDGSVCDVLTVNEYENLIWYLKTNEKEFGREIIERF